MSNRPQADWNGDGLFDLCRNPLISGALVELTKAINLTFITNPPD